MSVLAFPRLYLKGEMSWDPSVANNVGATYASGTASAVFQDGEDADGFRARMIRDTVQRGDWNYFGSHRCTMEGTTVVGGTSGPGAADTTTDPIIEAPVQLIGKLVDIDPYGAVSQVFFDELLVGVPGRPHLRARPRRRMVSRWLSFSRNRRPADVVAIAGRAGAAWQAVFRAEDVEIVRAEGSPLLSALAEALSQEHTLGLMLGCRPTTPGTSPGSSVPQASRGRASRPPSARWRPGTPPARSWRTPPTATWSGPSGCGGQATARLR